MQEHNFVQMDDVSPELLEIALYEMLGDEHRAVYNFDSYDYFWEFGREAFNRLMHLTGVYVFDIKYDCKLFSHVLMGLPVRVTDEPTKKCCVRLSRTNPRRMSSQFLYVNTLNKEETTMMQEKLLREYVDTDVAATRIAYNSMYKTAMQRSIKNVIFNDPATIVFWSNGTKTVVKAEGEPFDPEKGLAMAIAKKYLGNQGNYYDIFRKWLPKEEKEFPMNPPEEQLLEKEDDANTEILTSKQLAEKMGVSVSTVLRDCRRGLHPGAMKVNGKWLIPYSGLMHKMNNVNTRR